MSEQLAMSPNCPTCDRSIAKTRRGLSSVLYRQIVRDIKDKEDLLKNKDKAIRIIRRGSNPAFTDTFAHDLDVKVNGTDSIEEIKKWLLDQLIHIGYDSGEKDLYQFLYENYSHTGIYQPFTEFYANYSHWFENPMTKNFVSRALGAIGIKARMVRLDFEGRKKSAMYLKVSAEELHQLLQDLH